MPAKLICGICETTLDTGKEGRGVVIVLCDECQAALKAEMKPKFFRTIFIPRPRAA